MRIIQIIVDAKRQKVVLCLLSFFLLPLSAILAQERQTAYADHLILISIDGFRPDFYLDRSWPAPMLHQMAEEGAHAKGVIGVFPSVTYPSHTTMVTGAYPATHGVINNREFGGDWVFNFDKIKVPTIWNVANDAGMVTANVGWPVTLHAPIAYNVVISGALQNSGLADDPIRKFSTPAGLFDALEREAVGKIDAGDLSNSNPAKEGKVAEMVAYILEEYRPNVITVALQHTDSYQHRYGLNHPRVDRAVAAADRAISRIVEACEALGILDRTAFVISGDHGFMDISAQIAPNVWLMENGLADPDSNEDEWKAVFQTSGGSAFLRLNDGSDTQTTNEVKQIIDNLPASTRSLFTFIDRDELDRLKSDPDAPFALSGNPGVSFSGAREGAAIRPGSGGTHGHHPEITEMHIGFIAWGAGIRNGAVMPKMHLVDVAPLVVHLLGLELETAEGIVIPGLIEH